MSFVYRPLQQCFQTQQPVSLLLLPTLCKFWFSILRTIKNVEVMLFQKKLCALNKSGFIYRSGSAVVTSKLVFNSSSPVPSEALVLSAINTLRNSRESQLNESVKVVNVTYESKCHHFHLECFEIRLSQTMIYYRVLANLKITISFHTEISESSYAVVFTFNVTIISMPENPELRGNTNQQVQNTINNAVNLKN